MDSREKLDRIARERILILDGAMGTMLQSRSPQEADFRGSRFAGHDRSLSGLSDLLCLSRPDLVGGVHEAYLAAGADIIETCSLNSTAVSLADYGLEDLAYEMSRAAAEIARKAADSYSTAGRPRFVAGSIGPTNKSGSMPPDISDPGKRAVSWDELEAAFYDNARGLLDGGADLFLVETIFDALNAKAAIAAINRLRRERGLDVPLIVSATISGESGRLLSGHSTGAFVAAMLHGSPWALGFNCSFGAEKMLRPLRLLAAAAPCRVIAYPNAGFPDALGVYDESPRVMCAHVGEIMGEGLVNIVGGCCGSTPDHIAEIVRAAKKYRPRSVPVLPRVSVFAGHETLCLGRTPGGGLDSDSDSVRGRGFVCVGERTNVAGSREFLGLIREGRYDDALQIPLDMIEHGAEILNIGMDDPLLDGKAAITRFINLALADPALAKKPFMIDSSRWEIIAAAVKCIGGKALVNSISLKDGEAEFLRRAGEIRGWGAAAVVMLFDEAGQAVSYERKTEIAGRAWKLLTGSGFPPEDIVFDPNVLSIVTGMPEHNSYALAFIRACAWIREHCPGAQITGGVSNLSFSFRGNRAIREAMHAVFLRHAAEAGLTMAIVNPAALISPEAVDRELRETIEDVIFCRTPAEGSPSPPDRLIALAAAGQPQEGKVPAAQGRAPRTRGVLDGARGSGGATGGMADGAEYPPGETSGEPPGAEERVMRDLIRGDDRFLEEDLRELSLLYTDPIKILEGPLMRAMREVGDRFGAGTLYLPQVIRSARIMQKAAAIIRPAARPAGEGRILLATVKGDVHDIGKNIVSLVLGCNGFEVIDLGVQVPAELIVERAVREGADAIGLSGLITPSLDEMIAAARKMEEAGLAIPLLIGGAAASLIHTALRIAPAYSGPVVYVRDASRASGTLRALLSPLDRQGYLEEMEKEYEAAIEAHEKRSLGRETVSLEEARSRRFNVPWESPAPKVPGIVPLDGYPLGRVLPRLDWGAFLRAFGLSGDSEGSAEAARLLADGKSLLDRVVSENLLPLTGVVGIFPAAGENEDIIIFGNDDGNGDATERLRFTFPRNLRKRRAGASNPCLADFVAPLRAGRPAGWAGFFALSAGKGVKQAEAALDAANDPYLALLLANLANCLAEAFSEEIHRNVREEYWGYAPDAASRQGIRPAFGYPSCPDHQDKRKVFELLEATARCGLELTETGMILPAASVCGLYLDHPGSFYFGC